MRETILRDLGIAICSSCGVLIHMPTYNDHYLEDDIQGFCPACHFSIIKDFKEVKYES